jgi:amino acid transporter
MSSYRLFSYGLNVGGPAVMVWGWVVVSFFTFFVAMSMSEVVSAVPTSGGPYDWAARISRPENSAYVAHVSLDRIPADAIGSSFAAWVTGWFNFLGQVAITTGIVSVASLPPSSPI